MNRLEVSSDAEFAENIPHNLIALLMAEVKLETITPEVVLA